MMSDMAKTRQVSFRLPEEEYKRLAAVHERAKERTLGYAPFGDVVREALGLIPMNVITPEERDYIARKTNILSGADQKSQAQAASTGTEGKHLSGPAGTITRRKQL